MDNLFTNFICAQVSLKQVIAPYMVSMAVIEHFNISTMVITILQTITAVT